MAEVKKIADGKIELTTVLDGDKWQEAQKKAFNKLAKNVEIKGFRKGQAPKHMVENRLGQGTILAQAAEDKANEIFREALDQTGIELIDRADLDIKEIDDKHVVYIFNCPVKPDVELGEYKNLGYAPKEATVEDDEVAKQIDMILENKADLEIKEDGVVESGDTAVIDYDGFKDGVAFAGGHGENYELVIGSNSFIPGFEDALIGMKSEETKEINLTFPKDYHAEELKGQDVVFKVTVHEIKRKVLPELNDELVKELDIKDVSTPDELKKYIHDTLFDSKKRQNENEALNAILDKVCDGAKVDIPQVMIEDEIDQMLDELDRDFQNQGFSLDQYMKITSSTKDKLRENMKVDAEKRVKLRLVLEEIAKLENIEVSDEDVKCEIEDLANKYGLKSEDMEKMVNKDAIKKDLRMQKALDVLKA